MSRLHGNIAAAALVLLSPSVVSTGLPSPQAGLSEAEKFRLSVVRPVLRALGNSGCELETLLVATAAHESHLGRLHENVFQITEIAIEEIKRRGGTYPSTKPTLFQQARAVLDIYTKDGEYRHGRVERTPGTAREVAFLWKRVYNTPAGKGTVRKFLRDAEREGVKWCKSQGRTDK